MKILADNDIMTRNGYRIEIWHGNEVIYFNFAVFNKAYFAPGNEVFKHINLFWSQQTPLFQEEVFKIFKEISDYFEDILNKNTLTERLKGAVKRLFAMHPYKVLRHWVFNVSGITVPRSIKKQYERDADKNTTEDKTYIEVEYLELVSFALMLRLMVPIWAKYTKHIKSHAGNMMKELQAFKLLEDTEVPEIDPVYKILSYFRAKLKKDAANIPVSFISEEDFPYWNMTLFAVRKLSIGELQFRDENIHIVTMIHNFINSQSVYSDGDFTNTIHTKNAEDFGGEENKISTMECFRINMDISIMEAEELPFSVENLENTVKQVCFDLPVQLYEQFFESTKLMLKPEFPLMRPQRALIGWVLKNAINPLGWDYLDDELQHRCIALVQAVLWHRGFKYLALVVSSVTDIQNTNIQRYSGGFTKERVSAELQAKLREVYPHVRIIQNRKSDPREECFVTNDIEKIVDDLTAFSWFSTAPIWAIQEVLKTNNDNRRLILRSDIRSQLTELAIAVGQDKIANP